MPHRAIHLAVLVAAMAMACGPQPEDLDPTGTWSLNSDGTGTRLAFGAGGWQLIDRSGCSDGIGQAWFCAGQGTWRLEDIPAGWKEPVSMEICQQGGDWTSRTVWFKRHRMCWERSFLGNVCFHRESYEPE